MTIAVDKKQPLRVHMVTHKATGSNWFYATAVNVDSDHGAATKAESNASPQDAINKLWNGLLAFQKNDSRITTDTTSYAFRMAKYQYALPALTSEGWSHIDIRCDDDLVDYTSWSSTGEPKYNKQW